MAYARSVLGLILGGMVLLFIGTSDSGVTDSVRLELGVTMYTIMGCIFPSIAIIIFSTGALLDEEDKGTAVWVLSKPASRTAFILSKLVGGFVAFEVSIVLIPGLLVYLTLSVNFGGPFLPSYLAGLGVMMMWHMFIHFLCICLEAFFNEAGPVAGPASISLFFVNSMDTSGIGQFLPWSVSIVARELMLGQVVSSAYPLIMDCIYLILLFLIAIWRFGRQEF